MVTKKVQMTVVVSVSVDETKFTPDFMREFRESFYDFTTLDDHIEHLGQMYARDLYDNGDFIEGYGPTREMGIVFSKQIADIEVEIVP